MMPSLPTWVPCAMALKTTFNMLVAFRLVVQTAIPTLRARRRANHGGNPGFPADAPRLRFARADTGVRGHVRLGIPWSTGLVTSRRRKFPSRAGGSRKA